MEQLRGDRTSQHRRADEERPEDHDHPGEGGGGIACLGSLEGRDAVGDGSLPGSPRSLRQRIPGSGRRERFGGLRIGKGTDEGVVQEEKGLEEAHSDEHKRTGNENVGGNGKDRTRLAHAAQIYNHDQED